MHHCIITFVIHHCPPSTLLSSLWQQRHVPPEDEYGWTLQHKDCGGRAHSWGNKCLFWLTDLQSCLASPGWIPNQEFKFLYLVFTNGLPSILSDHPCYCPSPCLLFFHLTTYLLDYIALQRVSFCCTTPWINHMYTCISDRLYFLGSKITADGDCSHEIKRCLLLGRKVMTNLDSILKSRDITLPTKVRLIKAMVFPVVMYGCEIWTIKKAEHWRIDAFELWYWRRLLRVPWTARRSN